MKKFLLVIIGAFLAINPKLNADSASDQQPASPSRLNLNLKGGLSPTGKYQICIIGLKNEGYTFGFFQREASTPLFQSQVGGGFCGPEGASEIDSALWNDDESMVAIKDHGTRHSLEIYLLLIKGRKAIEIPLPKYGAAVLKAMENLHGGAERSWCLKPLKWDGLKFTFRLYGGPNMSDVTIRVLKSDPPRAVLISETAPKVIQGEPDF